MEPSPTRPATTRPVVTRPVFARHAASLLVVREGPHGPEVLMGIRGQGHRFMPNRLVFPGGAVDRTDGDAKAAAEPGPELLAVLHRQSGPRLARGVVLCAARELQEETGLTLGDPPRLDQVAYLCRAITPPTMPMRFNARFLVVSATAVQGEPRDSRELNEVGYRAVDAVMTQGLAQVTLEVLQRFQAWYRHRAGLDGAEAPVPLVYRRQAWMRDR